MNLRDKIINFTTIKEFYTQTKWHKSVILTKFAPLSIKYNHEDLKAQRLFIRCSGIMLFLVIVI